MALPAFVITLFVSAFLLFLVQPMIGKMILPKLGGTPQVWNTCMVFFQMTLLAGYAYTHNVSTRLPLRRQIITHCVLLGAPLILLLALGPFDVEHWAPPAGGNPIFATLALLALVVGLPFFVVSTSAPLLQKWFASTGHPTGDDPYYLYGASNLGSLMSLVLYPFLVEPNIPLSSQAWVWTVSYVVLAGSIIGCAYLVWKTPGALQTTGAALDLPPEPPIPPLETPAAPATPAPSAETGVKAGPAPGGMGMRGIQRKKAPKQATGKVQPTVAAASAGPDISEKARTGEVTAWRRVRWVLLAAIPVSLMLATTSYVSIDLSPFPLLWVIPLALYLLTFIVVFMKYPLQWMGLPHKIVVFVQPIGVAAMLYPLLANIHAPVQATVLCMVGFLLTTLMCHGELARDRPSTKHLTEFFLLMSLGGALGGVFNALFAPLLFVGVVEFPLAICLSCFLRPTEKDAGWTDELICQAFPGVDAAVRAQGDKIAQASGKPAPHSLYLLGYIMDPIMGLIAFGLTAGAFAFFTGDRVAGILGFVGVSKEWLGEPENMLWAVRLFWFGVPLIIAFLYSARPIRFGLAITSLVLVHLVFHNTDNRSVVDAKRTYFGVLRVAVDEESMRTVNGDPEIGPSGSLQDAKIFGDADYTFLMHGTTYHGRNYHYPPQLNRLATTYYHRKAPVGTIMERFNWFPGKQNTYHADARLPAAMVGLGTPLGVGGALPIDAIANGMSEPPYATIGLGTGTMASYGRPFQHVVFYEIDEQIRLFSQPAQAKERAELQAALTRLSRQLRQEKITDNGLLQVAEEIAEIKDKVAPFLARQTVNVLEPNPEDPRRPRWVRRPSLQRLTALSKELKDDDRRDPARLELAAETLERITTQVGAHFLYLQQAAERGANVEVIMGDAWMSMRLEDPKLKKEPPTGTTRFRERKNYYRAIIVDAFSSDAIPVHLITKEAIEVYLDKLTADGVLLVHTSNRHLDLTRPVIDIAKDLNLDWRIGKDSGSRHGGRGYLGHFGSEYVMLARKTVEEKDPETGKVVEKSVLGELYKVPTHPENVRYDPRDRRNLPLFDEVLKKAPGPVADTSVHWSKPRELPEWFAELDIDKNGEVSLAEWGKGDKDPGGFGVWDQNNNAVITTEEAKLHDTKLARGRIWTRDYSDVTSIMREGNIAFILLLIIGVPLLLLGAALVLRIIVDRRLTR